MERLKNDSIQIKWSNHQIMEKNIVNIIVRIKKIINNYLIKVKKLRLN